MKLAETKVTRAAAAKLGLGGVVATMLAAHAPQAMAAGRASVPYSGEDAIEILENDHIRIHHMLNELVTTTDHTARTALLKKIGMYLSVHNATEENFIYPAIMVVAGRPTDAALLYHQQDEAKQVVWMLGGLLRMHPASVAEFTAKTKAFRAAVLEHVAQEEKTDFPALRKALGAKLASVTADVREFRAAFA